MRSNTFAAEVTLQMRICQRIVRRQCTRESNGKKTEGTQEVWLVPRFDVAHLRGQEFVHQTVLCAVKVARFQ